MRMSWRILVPSLFTVGALVAGFLSVLQSALGQYQAAAQLIMLSMILDGFDGKLARVLRSTTPFGAELDTFVDYLSFGVAPAVLAYLSTLREMGSIGLLLPIMLAVTGALRLSRFRSNDPHRGQSGFTGLPITVAGGWIAMFVFLDHCEPAPFEDFSLLHGPVAAVAWGSALVFSLLQVSNVRYPKSSKNAVVFAGGVIGVLFLFCDLHLASITAMSILAYGVYYAFLTPLLALARRSRSAALARMAATAAAAAQEDEDEDEDEEEDPVPFRRP